MGEQVDDAEWLASRFEEHRPRLRAVAYRMLGSLAEAEDAVQDAWLRLSRADANGIDNLGGWLTTVVGRECLHVLRSRRRRKEVAAPLPDPLITVADEAADPEQEALIADSVGLGLLVVLDRLAPAERVAFVLHDMFDLPYADIAPLVGRSPATTRQLASRARRRVRGSEPSTSHPGGGADRGRQRQVVEAFYEAANAGDFDGLVALLDPDVVFRADYGPSRPPAVYRGSATVARQARAARGAALRPVLVNGLPGVVTVRQGVPVSIMAFTVADGRIVEIAGIRDAERVGRLLGRYG